MDLPTRPRPRDPSPAGSWHRVGSIVTIVIIVAALRLGEGVLVPMALASLFSFLLAPLVHGLEKIKFGRVAAVIVVTIVTTAGIGALGWAVWRQVGDLADNVVRYRGNVLEKLDAIGGESPIQRIERELAEEEQVKEDEAPGAAPATAPPPASRAPRVEDRIRGVEEKPVPVEVIQRKPGVVSLLRDAFGPYLGVLGTVGVVVVLTIFMLVYHEDLRDRFIRLVSRGQIVVTTQALAEASDRISRYLVTTLMVNALYGVPVGIGLYLLGVPNAVLWGLLATLLRFIPYLGPWIAAAFPIVLSMAVFPDWVGPAKVVGLFVVMELIGNNIVEPWLYGTRTGLSPVAVIVAAVFWTWLWGVVGLFLSIPLTLVLAVAGRYVPQFGFLNVLLRDRPGLRPEERFYQRLVAADPDEAAKIAEEFLKEHTVEELYDAVVIPALRAAKHDRVEGRLDPETMRVVRDGAQDLVEELAEREPGAAAHGKASGARGNGKNGKTAKDGKEADAQDEPAPAPPSTPLTGATAVFLPAGDETDGVAAQMLGDVLRRDGLTTRVLGGSSLTGEMIDAVQKDRPDVVCVVGLLPYAVLRARHLCKRLRSGPGATRIAVVLLDPAADPVRVQDRITPTCADRVAVTFTKAVEVVRSLASEALGSREAPEDAAVEAPRP